MAIIKAGTKKTDPRIISSQSPREELNEEIPFIPATNLATPRSALSPEEVAAVGLSLSLVLPKESGPSLWGNYARLDSVSRRF